MSVKSVLEGQLKKIQPDAKAVKDLTKLSKEFIKNLKEEIKKEEHDAQVFIGGSFAKGTLVHKDVYDVDLFVRFDWRFDNISDMLEKLLKKVSKKMSLDVERVHGSRDYFKCRPKNGKHYIEVIPVTKIKKVHDERNVTDLSYFHVGYAKPKLKGIEDQVLLAKTFCQAQKVYGAESYIRGFSGYALECLIIHYKTFLKMLRELSKVKLGERLVIDIEKHYKKKSEVFFEVNENRLHSPVILIDPTYKERNALAALGQETFDKFQKSAREFLKKPNAKFFEEEEIDPKKLEKLAKKQKSDFVHLKLETDRQEGDIAGTKMRKFSDFIAEELNRYFKVTTKEFEYNDKQDSDVYLIAKSKKKIVQVGPPIDGSKQMKKHAKEFLKEHPKAYEKNKMLHADIIIDFTAKEYLKKWSKKYPRKLKEMGITKISFK